MALLMKNTSIWMNRLFQSCGQFQWARETLMNSLEAGATKIEFGIELQAASKGIYRRTICDNGNGMSDNEIYSYFSQLGEGSKTIDGVHDNFGIGAKLALLPWNPLGVVVISYKNFKGSMIRIYLNEDNNEYELHQWEDEDGAQYDVIDPRLCIDEDIEWHTIVPSYITDCGHGTVIVLLGSKDNPHTFLGNIDRLENNAKRSIQKYLNTRFWDLSDRDISVIEYRGENLPDASFDPDKLMPREIRGAKHHIERPSKDGFLKASDSIGLDNRNRLYAHWFLWEGERLASDYSRQHGYIAVKYKNELYHINDEVALYRNFGINDTKVKRLVTIILEPKLSDGDWGVYPNEARSSLLLKDKSEVVPLPITNWAQKFAEQLPNEVLELLKKYATDKSPSDFKADLLKYKDLYQAANMTPTDNQGDQSADETVTDKSSGSPNPSPRAPKKEQDFPKRTRVKSTKSGDKSFSPMKAEIEFPDICWVGKEKFQKEWHLASYTEPNTDRSISNPTVYLNEDSPKFQQIFHKYQSQYTKNQADFVKNIVKDEYGKIISSKIAAILAYNTHTSINTLKANYCSEEALLGDILGYYAEDVCINSRLRKMGLRKIIRED